MGKPTRDKDMSAKDSDTDEPRSMSRHLPDSVRYQWRYYRVHKRLCDFTEPQDFSEKIFHRMRFPHPDFTRLADKVRVRQYVRETVGEEYNVPLYKTLFKVTAQDFDDLPNSFVMKANHSCGALHIVHDKRQEDIDKLVKLANGWMQQDFSRVNGERHYQAIRPQVIFEEALLNGKVPATDYKLHLFNIGKSECFAFFQVINDRFGERTTQNLFSTLWQPMPFKIGGRLPPSNARSIVEPPAELEQMIEISRRLALPFGYCRVDLYCHNGKVYVGELTFTPGAGELRFVPAHWDATLGRLFRWPDMRVPESATAEIKAAGMLLAPLNRPA